MYEENLVLNSLHRIICTKTKPTSVTKNEIVLIYKKIHRVGENDLIIL